MSDSMKEPEIVDERWVDFYGDTIVAVLAQVHGDLQVFVPVRHICEVLGINWDSQRKRITRDEVLHAVAVKMTVTARDSKRYKAVCLPLDYLHGWLFGITTSQVQPAHRARITLYRKECFRVLSAAFQADLALPDQETASVGGTGMTLVQVRDLALAVAQMAEQQLALEGRVDATHALATQAHTRLDKAAQVIVALQQRTSRLEDKVAPAALITEEQATAISTQVKALAHLLSRKEPGKNQYQSVFAELYRRFGVSSYKLIRQEQYEAVLAFLEDWRGAADSPKSEA